jgi:DNA mismatch repair protein MutL
MSSSAIQSLPLALVRWIAAGEVVDSWEAVARELLENSLDAGATHLQLSLWPEAWRLRLADNGEGMDLENLLKAASPHSTSKWGMGSSESFVDETLPDEALASIITLGFRGEALHCLAQVGDLEICSRLSIAAEGWRVIYDRLGQPLVWEPLAMAPGTIVTLSNLFSAPWSHRRHSLPPLKQSLRSVQGMIYNLALTHPEVTWQVLRSDRPWLLLRPAPTPRLLIPQCLPTVQVADLVEHQQTWDDRAGLDLVVGLPSRCHRRRPDWVKVAVNGRVIQCPDLEQVIFSAFHRTLPRHRSDRHSTLNRFPVVFAHLRIPPEEVDWNRHPHKTEIYLQNLATWQARLQETIALALRLPEELTGEDYAHQRVDRILRAAEQDQGYRVGATPSVSILPRLKAIAQLHQMYIVAESPTGLCLIEQHIAHERVLYEQLCDRWQLEALKSPVVLSHLQDTQVEQLHRLGMDCDAFGEQQWIIRTAPAPLIDRSDCEEALWELSLGGDLDAAQVAVACRTAIRNGTPLGFAQMQELLNQWQQTRNPHTCPHGRPICLKLEESNLSRFFRRHWVMGKSHGAFPL